MISEEEAVEYARQAYEKPENRKIENGEILPQYNYPNLYAIKHPTKGIVLSHRGTHEFSDLLPDFYILVGGDRALKTTYHYKRAQWVANKIRQRFPNEQLTHVGHSLGGTTAHFISKERDEPSYAFNPGSSPLQRPGSSIGENLISYLMKPTTANNRQRVIHTKTDLISVAFKGGEWRGAKETNAHSIDNFS